jgi:hypothetical protein
MKEARRSGIGRVADGSALEEFGTHRAVVLVRGCGRRRARRGWRPMGVLRFPPHGCVERGVSERRTKSAGGADHEQRRRAEEERKRLTRTRDRVPSLLSSLLARAPTADSGRHSSSLYDKWL